MPFSLLLSLHQGAAFVPVAAAYLFVVRRMSAAKSVTAVLGVVLLLVGLLMSAVSVLAIIDPAGAKAADDNDPFGLPPSLLSSVAMLSVFLCVFGLGVLVAWRSVRKR